MYYVYDFSEMLSELESIDSKSNELLSEIRQARADQLVFYDKVYDSFHFISVFLFICVAVNVLFK